MIDARQALALAILAGGAYAASPAGLVVDAGDDIRAVLTEKDGNLVVASRGTEIESVRNWFTDFDAIPEWHDSLGFVPRGFLQAALRLMPLLAPHVAGRRVVFTGHSLGGSLAILLTALLAAEAIPPVAYAAFEPAHTGGATLTRVLSPIPGLVTRFGDDPVPDLPPIYEHPCAVTAIGHAMPNPIDCHSISRVIAWFQAQQQKVAA